MSEERLVAHHYGDESARERTQAEQHLAACPECARQMTELASLLDAVQAPEAPARSETYGTEVWNRIRAHLPEQPERRSWFGWPQRWAVVGAVAVLVVAAFLVGRYVQSPAPGPNVAQQPAPEKVRERVLLVALGDHLEKSQMVLIEIANAPAGHGTVDISGEQQRAEDLVNASRLYRQTAQEVGDTATARVLEELERTLLDIAHGPSQLNEADLKRIQQRIEARGLIFKVRVIGAKVQREQRPQKRSGMVNESNQQPQTRKQI